MGLQGKGHTWVVMAGVVLALASASAGQRLVVDDFNDGTVPNALGGDFGTWNRYPEDLTQGCTQQFDPINAYGGAGYALRLNYDIDSLNRAQCGFWSKFGGVDLTPYHQLVLYLKGDPAGHTSQINVELKSEQEIGRYLLTGITETWQRFAIPFEQFEGLHDWSRVKELVIFFEHLTVTKLTGVIYLDEIAFE